jgi:hypothetical protein
LARPDVPAFPQAAVGRLGLHHPFRGEADNHQAAESLLGADHGAVRPVDPDMAGAIPEGLRGRTAVAAGKLAVHEPRLADAVPVHPGPASALFPERLAWSDPAQRWAQRHAEVARYKQDVGRFAA